MSGLRFFAQGGAILLIIFCMTCDLCNSSSTPATKPDTTPSTTPATTTTTTPSELENVKGEINRLYTSCNVSVCKEFSDTTILDNREQACSEFEAFIFCLERSKACHMSNYLVNQMNNFKNEHCASPKERVRTVLKPLEHKCEGRCDSLYTDVSSQDTLDETCGKLDSFDYCLSKNCDYFNAYKPTLDEAHTICDACIYHSVSIGLILFGLALSKLWTI